MISDFYNERKDLSSIVTASLLFHVAIVIALFLAMWLRPEKKPPPPIPFFELVNVAPPPPPPSRAKPVEPPKPEPVTEPVPEIKPELKPEVKPELKPEPKPVQKPEPKKESKPVPTPEPPEPIPLTQADSKPTTEHSMDMPMDMPSNVKKPDMDMPMLRMDGTVMMDPQIQAYLERLLKLIFQNFNPPSGTEIARGTKSSVAFKISRNGEINEVVLRSSSKNTVWDRLAVRAVQITKAPPLPNSYASEDLPLIFDFREK